MNTFLYVLYVAILAFLLGYVVYLRKRVDDANKREQGLDEIEQGYQAEIMDAEDREEALREQLHNVYESHRLLNEKLETVEAECEEKKTLIDELTRTVQEERGTTNDWHAQYLAAKTELDDVRQTALDMQIDLTRADEAGTKLTDKD